MGKTFNPETDPVPVAAGSATTAPSKLLWYAGVGGVIMTQGELILTCIFRRELIETKNTEFYTV